ncbi:hypothetical protein [Thiobacter aerophilum]|uniref:Uncharacterized protein n=1 Tax=Thiobacter aerophilum TaxID=3121275 RepID=A0ABV0EDV0_9BURK
MPSILLHRKPLDIVLSPRAEAALANLAEPLVAEMELYFSCLIRKAVRFRSLAGESDAVCVSEKLYVRFRPVVAKACGAKVADGPPPLTEVEVCHVEAFQPSWLSIDYQDGTWRGAFGYDAH